MTYQAREQSNARGQFLRCLQYSGEKAYSFYSYEEAKTTWVVMKIERNN
jgi:hypothetical protein